MYKCVHSQTGESILILETRWRSRIEELRRLDQLDQLVCQGCRQPMRVRAGKQRRWHFAHKHLVNCRFDRVSPALLEARAALYLWLEQRLGPGVVDVEGMFPELSLPRPFDLVVCNGEDRYAYWLIENRLHPAVRDQLQQAFTSCDFPVHVVFLSKMLHKDESKANQVFLTTTERTFACETPFDSLYQVLYRPVGKTIHYFDPESEQLLTFRDLHCVHTPQVFAGRFLQNPLTEVAVHPQTGVLSYPGEMIKLGKHQFRQLRREMAIAHSRQSLGRILDKMLPEKGQSKTLPTNQAGRPVDGAGIPHADTLMQERAVCQYCGQETGDWWYLDKKTGLCKCRDCLHRGLS